MDINGLLAALRTGLATIDFTKVNGAKRTMVATLEPSRLPERVVEGKDNKPLNDETIVVFDVEHHGWRTIRKESIHAWAPGDDVAQFAQEAPAPEAPRVIGDWAPTTPTPGA